MNRNLAELEVVEREVEAIRESEPSSPVLYVDCGNVQRIDSRDLNRLIQLRLKISAEDGELRLVNVSERLHEVLQLTRLDRLFQIELAEALPR